MPLYRIAPWHTALVVALSLAASACATSSQATRTVLPDAAERARLDAIPCDQAIFELNPVYFEPASTAMTADGEARLGSNLYQLNRCPDISFSVNAYTDQSEYAKGDLLSTRRAEAVQAYYIVHGLAAERIVQVTGRGQDPIAGVFEPSPSEIAETNRRMRRADSIPIRR